MNNTNAREHLAALRVCIGSIKALRDSFEATLKTPVASPPNNITNRPENPLALFSSAAIILKAQTTKISLLALNSPFTPSAITQILNSVSTSCLPALMTALELCPPTTYSALLHNQMGTLISRAFHSLAALPLAAIPENYENGTPQWREKTLNATGMLWETCDKMSQLASTGLPALATEKLDTSHTLLKDAIAELEEWDPNDEGDPGTDSNPDDSNLPILPAQTSHLLNLTLRFLRQIRLLYPAIKKCRLRSFPPFTLLSSEPPSPSQIQTIDTITTALGDFASEADELADALYSKDQKEVLRLLSFLRAQACDRLQLVVVPDWKGGEEDEFSVWARKWVEETRGMDVGEGMA